MKYSSDVNDMENKWKNPNCRNDPVISAKEDNFLEELDRQRVMNSDGVEILQTILEEEEPETVGLETNIFDGINKREKIFKSVSDGMNRLRLSLQTSKFLSSVIYKSCDTFSYLLFITLILPNLALKQYQFEDRGKVVYMIMLMGFTWMVYTLLILKFHHRLRHNWIQNFHILGLLGKFFGYLCEFFLVFFKDANRTFNSFQSQISATQ